MAEKSLNIGGLLIQMILQEELYVVINKGGVLMQVVA